MLQPGLLYYYFSTIADVSANEYTINGSGIFFDNNASFATWYKTLPFNRTLPLFGPRAYRFDDYNEPVSVYFGVHLLCCRLWIWKCWVVDDSHTLGQLGIFQPVRNSLVDSDSFCCSCQADIQPAGSVYVKITKCVAWQFCIPLYFHVLYAPIFATPCYISLLMTVTLFFVLTICIW